MKVYFLVMNSKRCINLIFASCYVRDTYCLCHFIFAIKKNREIKVSRKFHDFVIRVLLLLEKWLLYSIVGPQWVYIGYIYINNNNIIIVKPKFNSKDHHSLH